MALPVIEIILCPGKVILVEPLGAVDTPVDLRQQRFRNVGRERGAIVENGISVPGQRFEVPAIKTGQGRPRRALGVDCDNSRWRWLCPGAKRPDQGQGSEAKSDQQGTETSF